MDPQSPPPAPSPATVARPHQTPSSPPAQHHRQILHHQQHAPESEYHAPYPYPYPYSEKHAAPAALDRPHDSVISSHPLSPKASSPPSPSSSISSGRKHRSIQEIQQLQQLQLQQNPRHVSYPPRAHLDPEKAQDLASAAPRSQNRASSSNPEVTAVLYDSGEYREKGPEDKAVQLLFYLSGACAILSFGIMFYALFAILIALMLAPLALFSKRPPLADQIKTFLAPPLNLQLHLVYSYSSATDYSPPMLVVIHLFSPAVAVGVAIAAWVAACFWFFSAILGDPAGQDGHNDGKDSILGVRNWWDRWLSRGLR